MKKISLESSARLSLIEVREIDKEKSVDIIYKSNDKVDGGVYNWEEVKQFVRELAEALDMTLEETAPKVEPIVLSKDVYEEVERCMKYIYSDENPKGIKRRADAKLWTNCRSDSGMHLATYIANNAGASVDIARVFMKELPYECEGRGWVLFKQLSQEYLSKAVIKPNGLWQLEYSPNINEAIKFPRCTTAESFANTISHLVYLGVKEV